MPASRTANPEVWDDPLPHQVPGRSYYSINRAIRCLALNGKLDGLEAETSQELAQRMGLNPPQLGFYLPWDARVQQRAFDTTTGAGGALIPTYRGELIDLLRSKLVLARLGATVMPDLRGGKTALPVKAGTVTLGWLSEGGAPDASVPEFPRQVLLEPRATGGRVQVTRNAINTIPGADAFLISDLLGAIAAEIERVAINGSGQVSAAGGIEPLGLLQNPGVHVEAIGTDGGAPTRAVCIEMERAVGNANADQGSLGWLGSPDTRSAMRAVQAAGGYLWSDQDTILSAPAVATTNVPNAISKGASSDLTALIHGDFSQLILALWGPALVIVNPYKYSADGYVEITAIQDVDIACRHTSAFAACIDIAQS